jgi:uncharacterized repeat protein (TIGR01451 family)
VQKIVSEPRRISRNIFELDYTIKVRSLRKPEDKAYRPVRIADNLDCTFKMDQVNGPIKSWTLVSPPTVEKGLLVSAGWAYKGYVSKGASGLGYCDRTKLQFDDKDGYPLEQSLNLVDGNRELTAGQEETIHFTVRIVRNFTATNIIDQFVNKAYAAMFDSNNINGSTLVVAASSSVSTLIIDPSGIVYDSVDPRIRIANAKVIFTRSGGGGCATGFDSNTNLLAQPGVTYRNTNELTGTDLAGVPPNSVVMFTGADGRYYFFLNNPSVNCDYSLSVVPPVGSGYKPSIILPVGGVNPTKLSPTDALFPSIGSGDICDAAFCVQDQDEPPTSPTTAPYYFRFNLGPNPRTKEVLYNHIPLDPATNPGAISLYKKANKAVVEIGDSVLYTLQMTNNTDKELNTAVIKDILPRGFRLISGSGRLGTTDFPNPSPLPNPLSLPNPLGSPGANLQFNLSGLSWKGGTTLALTYVVQVGVGASMEKTSINRAQVFSNILSSNQSSASVLVTGGVFSDESYLIGKVFLENCKADKVQNKEDENGKEKNADEVGIPGVRLILEDGTSVVTDIEGKYSLYGLSPITHVLKLDKSTLPLGSRLIVLSNRNSGKGDSRFVDLKKGELHKADFAVDRCNADEVVQEVYKRRKALQQMPNMEGEALIRQKLDPSYTDTVVSSKLADARTRPASGVLTPMGAQSLGSNNNLPTGLQGSASSSNAVGNISGNNTNAAFQTILPLNPNASLAAQRLQESFPARPSVIPLEEVVKNLDSKVGFIDLKDGDTLPTDVVNIRVKGVIGATLQLKVNGVIESQRRVGKKSKIADKGLEAWEYIGVNLKVGTNQLLLESLDSFGNSRESKVINVIAPGKAGKVELDAPQTAAADFKTPVKIIVRLLDDNGVPVTSRTQVTLEADQGRWETKDLNPIEPGLQAFMEGGKAEFILIPPGEPKDGIVRVTAGILQREVKIAFVPELRPLVGVGIIEGVLDFSKAGKVNVNAPTAFDAFERELRNLSVSGNDMKARGRAAFYFKGTIKGEYLLTTAYDSDKDTKQRLFRDIQPAKFYPIYGDSSLKSFDAQSTQRFYLRVDKQKSYLLYGDFTTAENNEARKLSQYTRSVTGVKTHYENGDFSATAFASRDSLSQGVLEIPANGTSGPYKLNTNGNLLYENSEKVEILVRDKNQPSIILESISLSRFSDYSVDPITNEIFFKGPVASIDANLNPRSIRVTYEVQKGGKEFWMVGGDARLKLTDYLELGASYARDGNPQKKSQLMGATATARLGTNTTLIGEVARTSTGQDTTGLSGNSGIAYLNQNSSTLSGEGWAERVMFRHSEGDFKADAQVTHAGKSFNNPTAGISSGRTEATANASYKIVDGTNLKAQAIYSKDNNTGGMRSGFVASIQHAFNDLIKGELGVRAAHETSTAAQPTSVGTTPYDLLAIRAKLGSRLPWIDGADVYGEAEQDVLHSNRRMLAAGAGYLLNDKTRLYGRYQFISSISNSSYALNSLQQNNTAVFGVESTYIQDGRLFSEYRVRDAINGRESQAAVGLRQTWTLAEGFKLGGSFEMTHAFAGQAGSDSKAITALTEYTADPRYKLTGSLEARFASAGNSYLNSLGLAYKIDDDWSLLARNTFSVQETRSSQSALWRTRQQIGVAWRQVTENRWNALARYEHRLEFQKGGIDPYSNESHIFSTHVNYQPHRDVITSGRYAFKYGEQKINDIDSKFIGHLLYGRVMWDFLPDWDIGLQAGMMADQHSIQYAQGVELGHQAWNDLWLSAGYNFRGFDAGDLKSNDYTSQGFYVRMRFKFDEGLFQ